MSRNNGTAGVTSRESRATFYLLAMIVVITSLGGTITSLWFDRGNMGTLHKFMYVLLGAATIPYIGLLVSCMCNDVPVPSYRLGADGRYSIYLATMILEFCIACNIKEVDVVVEMSLMAILVIVGMIAIVQLYSPLEDLYPTQVQVVMFLGVMFAGLGWLAKESWPSFFASLCFFPGVMCVIHHGSSLAAEARRRLHHHQPLLPV